MVASSSTLRYPSAAEVASIAVQAGELTMQYFRKKLQISEKSDNQGIVTEADVASEECIKTLINLQFKGHSVLAEESGLLDLSKSSDVEVPFWIIDPIDGTTNFSKGNPYYCVSIGFGVRTKSGCQMRAACIVQPSTGDVYTAERGRGAYCNGALLQVKNVELSHASLATGFSSNKDESLKKVIKVIGKIQQDILGLRINGAAALDLALTARGVFQGFYERPLSPWDMAAGSLIVQEAGGTVTNLSGKPFDALRDRDVIACTPSLYEFLFKQTQVLRD